jgi:peptidyl-tRNA hydrolase
VNATALVRAVVTWVRPASVAKEATKSRTRKTVRLKPAFSKQRLSSWLKRSSKNYEKLKLGAENMSPARLYLVVRADLSAGQQAVQGAHALREFVHVHPEIDRNWYQTSNTLAFLSVPGEMDLLSLLTQAQQRGFSAAPFREPDRNDELTAVAFGPECRKLLSRLPLALREATAA